MLAHYFISYISYLFYYLVVFILHNCWELMYYFNLILAQPCKANSFEVKNRFIDKLNRKSYSLLPIESSHSHSLILKYNHIYNVFSVMLHFVYLAT